jgi:hypothetical protein
MTFDELRLAMAVRMMNENVRDSAANQEMLSFANRVQQEYARIFQEVCFPFFLDDVRRLATNVRKNKDVRIKADVALAHGVRCFWSGRGMGECSDEAECGHLVPRCRGGELSVANCIIECRRHNNERREKTIEEYLQLEIPHENLPH